MTGANHEQTPAPQKSSTITLALPFPPSVNAIWRNLGDGKVILSTKAQTWWRLAEGMYFLQKRGLLSQLPQPLVKFEAELVFDAGKRSQLSDIDNLSKLPLDAAQRFNLIVNDRGCEKLTATWGKAHGGCLLTIRGIE
jgi:crossover junction endodeoxyribonuclease RusA